MSSFALPVYSLWLRDLRQFFRRRSRVLGAIGQPIVIWLFLGAGFGTGVVGDGASGMSYAAFLFPGMLLLITLFSAIFSTISVIEDRRSGFMQGVLVSPASRGAILWGKIAAGATLSFAQAMLFLLFLPWIGVSVSAQGLLLAMLVLLLAAVLLTSLGLLIAWRMSSTQGFHAIMNLLLMPMWVLSGALFPVEGAHPWLAALMRLNPMYYVTSLFHDMFFLGSGVAVGGGASWMLSLAVIAVAIVALHLVTLNTVAKS
jgi:ABC-2 type transport system permease protein